jgi:hypothetical protein
MRVNHTNSLRRRNRDSGTPAGVTGEGRIDPGEQVGCSDERSWTRASQLEDQTAPLYNRVTDAMNLTHLDTGSILSILKDHADCSTQAVREPGCYCSLH